MAVVAHLAKSIMPVVDFVYPPRCPACGIAIASQEGLCPDCWGSLEVPSMEKQDAEETPVFAETLYNDTSRRLVLAYKHGGRIALSRLLARMVATRLPACDENARQRVLVPVTLNRWRLWHRGFNQAALLASELEKLGKGEVLVDALRRPKRTPSLGGLGRKARDQAMAGAIATNPRYAAHLKGRDVLLVDDVFTSGATSRACVEALREAGPASVAIACFARVGTEG